VRDAKKAIESFIFPFDGITSKAHAVVFIRYRWASLLVATAAYAAAVIASGDTLGVSSNYFIIGPVIVAALGFGTLGGLVAGLLGLPSNLLLYGLLGHPEFSPASKLIAELSGLVIGFSFGRLADYFRVVEREIKRRMATEEALRAALEEKGVLLRELHHRVKNNLNVMKSLVQLQRNRSGNAEFLQATDELTRRIFAISLVHDQLYSDQELSAIGLSRYIEALVANLASGFGLEPSRIGLAIEAEADRLIPADSAIALGLIMNEVLMNALKHASPAGEGKPSILVSLAVQGGDYRLSICDDGPGPGTEGGEDAAGLGLKLVRALARSLGGTAALVAIEGAEGPAGSRFDLTFPRSRPPSAANGGPADQASPMYG
jgi:two-component sensor histidine kinase